MPPSKALRNCFRFKVNFNAHVDQKLKTCNRIIGLIRRLSVTLPRNALLTIYKTFVTPHLGYGDILYDKPNNEILRTNYKKFSIEPALQ